eukprot:GHVO01012410.1.p1 GENE.GHVO01012410.1~~GHVO01012410.1.p1  ORF type:complete len:112 (-),score=5.85 GHVO01012410.1:1180-1515(-)
MVNRQRKHTLSTNIEQGCLHQSQPFPVTASPSMDIEMTAKIMNDATLDIETMHVTVSDSQGNTTSIDIPRISSTPMKLIIESSSVHILFEHSEAIVLFSFRGKINCSFNKF